MYSEEIACVPLTGSGKRALFNGCIERGTRDVRVTAKTDLVEAKVTNNYTDVLCNEKSVVANVTDRNEIESSDDNADQISVDSHVCEIVDNCVCSSVDDTPDAECLENKNVNMIGIGIKAGSISDTTNCVEYETVGDVDNDGADTIIDGRSAAHLVDENKAPSSNKPLNCKREAAGITYHREDNRQHPGLRNGNADWFRVLSAETTRAADEGLVCSLWVVDRHAGGCTELWIDIFDVCILGTCACRHFVVGAIGQIRPCRVFAEAFCRGDTDPDWEYVLRGACFGFRVIDQECVSAYTHNNYSSITKGDTGKIMTVRLKNEIAAGLLCVVSSPCTCVHPLGAVPKGHDDFRAIVDCSSPSGFCVNEHTMSCRTKFSYNSVENVTAILQEGDFMATIDISNAYRAVNIHPACRERQGLSWDFGNGVVHMRDNRLCMGLSSSPFVFSKISDFIVRCMVRENWDECVNYLDDFCVVSRSEQRCVESQQGLVGILRRLGFYISFRKLTPPSRINRFLGIDVDSVLMELRLPLDKLEKLVVQLKLYMKRRKATRLELEGLGGVLAHCCKVVHGGRTFSRRVYDLIASAKKASHKVRLNEEFRKDLAWWLEFAAKFNGKAKIIQPHEPVISVYSDASKFGFGALHGEDWVAGAFDFKGERELQGWLGHHFVYADEQGCRSDNINVLELWPIVVGVRRWGAGWRDRSVVFVTDNTQVMAGLNSGRSRNKISMAWLRIIFWASITHNFEVKSVYVNTKSNVICDSLSRLDKFKNIARIRDADQASVMCCHNLFNR